MPDNLVTAAQLQRFAPSCDFLALAPALDRSFRAHGIDTPRRVRHAMAQFHHESQGFTRFEENLNYSAERLMAVWPRRFPTLASAQPFARNPQRLADKVYGGRFGNVRPGDGWRYRGSGVAMLTFHDNYKAAERWAGLPLVERPELAREPKTAVEIAAAFWEAHGLNAAVDADADEAVVADLARRLVVNERDDLVEATEEINGGRVGLDDRARQLQRAAFIWAG